MVSTSHDKRRMAATRDDGDQMVSKSGYEGSEDSVNISLSQISKLKDWDAHLLC